MCILSHICRTISRYTQNGALDQQCRNNYQNCSVVYVHAAVALQEDNFEIVLCIIGSNIFQ